VARLLALAAALALAWLLARAAPPEGAFQVTALAMGIALLAATLAGSLIEKAGLPRVTGYLLFGMICGPYIANIVTRPMARELAVLNGLAVTLIAFVAGLEVNLARLAPRMRAVATLSGVTLLTLYAGLFATLWLVWPWLGIGPELAGMQRIAAIAVLTTLIASFSPTVTIAVVAEARASGALTELTLAVVILADLVLILVFTLVMELVRQAFGGTAEVGLIAGVAWEVVGSMAFGAAAGAVFSLYLTRIGRELPFVVLACCAAIAGAAPLLHLEPLMSALAAGLVVENLTPSAGDRLKHAVEQSALPVLVIFFAAAGASLQLDAVATIGTVAGAIALVRLALIRVGVLAGRRAGGLDDSGSEPVWMGLISQAGVTLGLALIVAAEYPGWGSAIQTFVLALIAMHQLVGPVLFKRALDRAGETGRADALTDSGTENTVRAG
jgi:Kef-type K+ transport system membrane component KefB